MAQFNNEVNLPMYVGAYLKQALRSRGITQEDFAEYVGVSDRTMRRWVSGDIHSLDSVSEIARALGVSVWDIFSNREDVPYQRKTKRWQRSDGKHRIFVYKFFSC